MISLLWGRLIAIVTTIVSVAAAILGWRYSIRKDAKRELSEAIQKQAIESIEVAKEVENEVAQSDGDAIVDRLRDNGWLRE